MAIFLKIFRVLLLLAPAYLCGQNQTVGLFLHEEGVFEGYTLFGSGTNSTQYLIDNCGNMVHKWESPEKLFFSAKLLPDGRLLRIIYNNRLQLINWDGSVDYEYVYQPDQFEGYLHHDVSIMPNGHLLVFASEKLPPDTAIAYGRDPAWVTHSFINSEKILEIDPQQPPGSEIVWEWRLRDHLIQDFDSTRRNFGVVAEHPGKIDFNYTTFNGYYDFFHANTLEYDVKRDQILLCSRFFHEFYILDHSTTTAEAATSSGGRAGKGGDFLYRWGNPAAYRAGDTTDQILFGPHHPHIISDSLEDAGEIMIFNNGWQRTPPFSEVLVFPHPADSLGNYQVPVGSPPPPVAYTWQYRGDPLMSFSSEFVSGAQRLPNGNTLICDGAIGGMFEVTPTDEMVWRYINPHAIWGPVTQGAHIPWSQNFLFRAIKYPPDYPAFYGKDLSPKGKIELAPFPDNCEVTYEPPQPPPVPEKITVFPNPASESIYIRLPNGPEPVEIRNVSGQILQRIDPPKYYFSLTVEGWRPGLYFLRTASGATAKFMVNF